jgi:RNA polymerase sigma-70 factor (ECF subfamily)
MSILLFKSNRQMTDEQLMLRVSKGSESAFEELYRRYARRLQGFFFRQLGGDEMQAADYTHDVFLRVYEARDRYLEDNNVATWFFSIAYNLCKNTYRHNEHVTTYLATLDAEPVSEEEVEVQMDREALNEALRQVLQSLPPPLRLLFALHYEEELTIPQIAQIEHLPEGTVKSRLHKTITLIRKKLQQYDT